MKIKAEKLRFYKIKQKLVIPIEVNSEQDELAVRFANNETDKERKRGRTFNKNCVLKENIDLITSNNEDASKSYSEKEIIRILHKAINRLPKKQNYVIIEHFFNNKSLRKIAREKGLFISTVKETKDRALKNLRKALEKNINVIAELFQEFNL